VKSHTPTFPRFSQLHHVLHHGLHQFAPSAKGGTWRDRQPPSTKKFLLRTNPHQLVQHTARVARSLRHPRLVFLGAGAVHSFLTKGVDGESRLRSTYLKRKIFELSTLSTVDAVDTPSVDTVDTACTATPLIKNYLRPLNRKISEPSTRVYFPQTKT